MFSFGDNVDRDKLSNSNEPATVNFRQNADKDESQQLCPLLTLPLASVYSEDVL